MQSPSLTDQETKEEVTVFNNQDYQDSQDCSIDQSVAKENIQLSKTQMSSMLQTSGIHTTGPMKNPFTQNCSPRSLTARNDCSGWSFVYLNNRRNTDNRLAQHKTKHRNNHLRPKLTLTNQTEIWPPCQELSSRCETEPTESEHNLFVASPIDSLYEKASPYYLAYEPKYGMQTSDNTPVISPDTHEVKDIKYFKGQKTCENKLYSSADSTNELLQSKIALNRALSLSSVLLDQLNKESNMRNTTTRPTGINKNDENVSQKQKMSAKLTETAQELKKICAEIKKEPFAQQSHQNYLNQ